MLLPAEQWNELLNGFGELFIDCFITLHDGYLGS